MIKLMIVDDESSIRRGLKHYIDWNAWGISLEAEASDGEEAFRRALEVRPDILISDIRMPEKDGLELCSLLRDALPGLLFIYLLIDCIQHNPHGHFLLLINNQSEVIPFFFYHPSNYPSDGDDHIPCSNGIMHLLHCANPSTS